MIQPKYALGGYQLQISAADPIVVSIKVLLDLLPDSQPYDPNSILPSFGAWNIDAAASEIVIGGFRFAQQLCSYSGPDVLQIGENTLSWQLASGAVSYNVISSFLSSLPVVPDNDQGTISGVFQIPRLFDNGALGTFSDLVNISICGDRVS